MGPETTVGRAGPGVREDQLESGPPPPSAAGDLGQSGLPAPQLPRLQREKRRHLSTMSVADTNTSDRTQARGSLFNQNQEKEDELEMASLMSPFHSRPRTLSAKNHQYFSECSYA